MSTSSFYSRCLDRCGPVWEQAATHPFVQGLARGTLTTDQIQCYLIQDGIYLTSYVQVCRALAKRSRTEADRIMFEESARLSEEGEVGMQQTLSQALGLPVLHGEAMPATTAYSVHEQASAADPSLLVALAGATPCNVLYAEVGKRLKASQEAARPGHPYRVWLDLYADELVQQLADQWAEVLNRWALDASTAEQEQALDAFAVSMQHEVDFWDQAGQAGG